MLRDPAVAEILLLAHGSLTNVEEQAAYRGPFPLTGSSPGRFPGEGGGDITPAAVGRPAHTAHDATGDAIATAELYLVLRARLTV